jgi:hypothetical protein
MTEMAIEARKVTRRHKRQRYEIDTVAFFCMAMRREVLEQVGYLDEIYGIGFFEDDDYCRRVIAAGYRIQIVDDVSFIITYPLHSMASALSARLLKWNATRPYLRSDGAVGALIPTGRRPDSELRSRLPELEPRPQKAARDPGRSAPYRSATDAHTTRQVIHET